MEKYSQEDNLKIILTIEIVHLIFYGDISHYQAFPCKSSENIKLQ